MFSICTATLILPLTAVEPKLTIEGAPQHPTVRVTPEDVAKARRRIQSDPAAKDWLDSVRQQVAPWNAKEPAWVRSVIPNEGACFAYGFTGCPICSAKWGTWGGARASFKKPGHVTCAGRHVLPDKEHPDTGMGFVAKDKRVHYFVGSYNAWVVETLTFNIAKPYSLIYVLTGDEKAGRMTAVILDEIARIYPSCDKGSWDYPSNPPSGRLNRPWYQVARVLVHYVDMYDRIFDHPALDEPSSRQGLNRRENIEKNLLLNGAKYCYEQSANQGGLHNGQADYLRGVLAVGVVLGIPEYVTWPVDGPFGIRSMMANNIDRDGQYFETSAGYALHTRDLYLTFAEPLLNYRGRPFPNGLNLHDDPKFEAFFVLPQTATMCLGHSAPYGDHAPAIKQSLPPYLPSELCDDEYAEHLATRISDPAKRASYAALLAKLRDRSSDVRKRMAETIEWRVFHAPDELPQDGHVSEKMTRITDGSCFFGQKGIAVLRRGKDAAAHAAILRFGPSLVHGHMDDLNVNYFAHGYETTYDIGYSLGSTHTQVGWAKQTISHNTVVVDETSQGKGAFGGSLLHFAELPQSTLAEASSSAYAHAGVDLYRRLIALSDRYVLDVFRLKGGSRHDLPLHAMSTNVVFDHLRFDKVQPGSLAGADCNWGAMQLNDGDMKGHPGRPYWNPSPGNGYGFLAEPARAKPITDWSASWQLDDKSGTRFQLLALADAEGEVVTAVAPGLYPNYPKARHVIRRRNGKDLSSCFVSLWQTYTNTEKPAARNLRRIDTGTEARAESGVALTVELSDGMRDFWCLGPSAESVVTGKDGQTGIRSCGAIATCRLDGKNLVSAGLLEASTLEVAGWTLTLETPQRSAVVAALPGNSPSIQLDGRWEGDGRYCGNPAYFSSPHYSRNSAYRLCRAEPERIEVESAGTILGIGIVDTVADDHTLTTQIPHEYAKSIARGGTRFFEGKLLRTEDGTAATRIREVRFGSPMTILVESTARFKAGQRFFYHDVQPGDNVTVHHFLTLHRTGPHTYELNANGNLILSAPGGVKVEFEGKNGRPLIAEGGRIARADLPSDGRTKLTLIE